MPVRLWIGSREYNSALLSCGVSSSFGPLMALIAGFVGVDRFLRPQLGEEGQEPSLEGAGGGEIAPIGRDPEVA